MNGTDLRYCIRTIEALHEQLQKPVWSTAERAELLLDLSVAQVALAAAKQALIADGFAPELVNGLEQQYIMEWMEGISHENS